MDSIDNASSGYLEACHIRKVDDEYLTCVPNENEITKQFNPNGYLVDEHGYLRLLDEKPNNTIQINSEYVDLKDIDVQRKRRLPMPPASKPLPPRKNSERWCQSFKELCTYCRDSRLILSITLSVLAAVALGVVIFLVVTNIEEPEPSPWDITTPKVPNDEIPVGSSGTLKFRMPPVQNPEVLDLLQESNGQNITILHLQNVKFNSTNRTWSVDGRDISIGYSIIDEGFHILLNVEISNTQCRHAGKYFVFVSGSKGNAEQSLSYKVKVACPCEVEYEMISGKVLQCELKVKGNTTVRFDKVGGETIIYQTGIRIPDNVPEQNRFSATWRSDGTLITRIMFSPVQCHDEGKYYLTVISRAETAVHSIYVKVKDYPKTPTISIPKGLIHGVDSELQCQASTGCTKANLTLEITAPNGQDYYAWEKSLTTKHYQEGFIRKTNVTVILTKDEVNPSSLHNRFVRCTYSVGGNKYDSVPIHMKVIRGDVCNDTRPNCDYPHPYDCNKYITCTIIPVERTCPSGLHFPYSANCSGTCVYPHEAKCNIGQ